MQTSFSMTSNASNLPSSNASNFWSNGTNRKRKNEEMDFDDKSKHKIFLTEERLIRNMQTLSLDLSVDNSTSTSSNSQENQEENPPELHMHQLLKDNLRKDNLHDKMIDRLCELERKKLSMQIVPYMPIHPAQLNMPIEKEDEIEIEEEKHPDSPAPILTDPKSGYADDDELFKKPFVPTPYFVEEPPDNFVKRSTRMKRSFSQSQRSNSNISVMEIRNDIPTVSHSSTDYLIFEPSTPLPFDSSSKSNNHINSSFSTNRPSIQITEYYDFPDDIEMQSTGFADAHEAMT